MSALRNIAIIAHVDHGKTTLVDALLKQSDSFRMKTGAPDALIMDSNELERERGITIFSKNAAVTYQGTKINIVDTPGHADFGGEVERIMRMVEGALLLVDAKEGPMPQTKFVLKKAIEAGLRVIVVINKIDKEGARCDWALNKTFDLFVELGASDRQADFPVIYASGVAGKAGHEADLATMTDIAPLFDTIVAEVPAPQNDPTGPLAMLVVNLGHDAYKGAIAIGKVTSGVLKKGMTVTRVGRDGSNTTASVGGVMVFSGLGYADATEVSAGDIAAVFGVEGVSIGDGLTDPAQPQTFPIITIEEPTVSMVFSINTSPFAGREGTYVTSRHLNDRLMRELQTDVALRVEPTDAFDAWRVYGRGELHLTILIEKMRREGYEFQVARPEVVMKTIDGVRNEPVERAFIELPDTITGVAIEAFGTRRGTMQDMRVEGSTAFMEFLVPTRGLIGFRNEFTTATKGMGIMHTLFEQYAPYQGDLTNVGHGSLIASESGTTRAYGLLGAEERGALFIPPGVEVYEGMVVGQNAKELDLRVNVCREKKLSNMRAKNDGSMEFLKAPRIMGLEDAVEYIGDDELVEVTPEAIRIRKRYLTEAEAKRHGK